MMTMTSHSADRLRIAHHSDEGDVVRHHFVGDELLRGVLVRERKRADRSNQPLALLVVKLDDPAPTASPVWIGVLDGLSALKRETDILGWFEPRTSIGLIMPEIPSPGQNFARELEARVHRELGRRLAHDTMNRISIRVHVHAREAGLDSRASADPLFQEVGSREQSSVYENVKRAFDCAGSLALLLMLSPLLLLIAALIKLTSPGPVLFRQVRVGTMMKPFEMLKFRTMHVNIKHDIHHEFVTSFIKSGAKGRDKASSGVFKITNDPRVTTVGRLLRKTSLDELPQLWNVVRGEMSLVGPRPPLPYEVVEYQPWHCRRVLEAKPGITGLWQVAGRSRTTFDEMVRLDLRYAKTRSFWTDMKILLATPAAVIVGRGAY